MKCTDGTPFLIIALWTCDWNHNVERQVVKWLKKLRTRKIIQNEREEKLRYTSIIMSRKIDRERKRCKKEINGEIEKNTNTIWERQKEHFIRKDIIIIFV